MSITRKLGLLISVVSLLQNANAFARRYLPEPCPPKAHAWVTRSLDHRPHLIDQHGASISEDFDFIDGFSEGLAIARQGDKRGFIDESGKWQIVSDADEFKQFSEHLAAFKKGDRWGYIDEQGTVAIPARFEWATGFSEGLAIVGVGKEARYINKFGEVQNIFNTGWPWKFVEGLSRRGSGLYGYVNRNGEWVIPRRFESVSDFSEGIAFVQIDSSDYTYIDRTGNPITQIRIYTGDPFRDGMAAAEEFPSGRFGFLGRDGEWKIPPTFREAHSFCSGMANVEFEDGKWGYIDRKGAVVIPGQYESAMAFEGELAMVYVPEGKMLKAMYINKMGKAVWESKPFLRVNF